MSDRLPAQRWHVAPARPECVAEVAAATGFSPLLAQVLVNRGADTRERAAAYVNPESVALPSPLDEFPDLQTSVELLRAAIAEDTKIAICGDYDADGMTSTALLVRAIRHLGGQVDYAIPSRMREGYGINIRIVEEFAATGVGLVLTVDNGISARGAIARAVELGLDVIITDHHDLPETLPPASAILNPKLLRPESPYAGLAGVGVAYVLAVSTAQAMGQLKGLTQALMELFTLGTIADLAPLTGVNRRWLKRGLRLLPVSQLAGVQALIEVSGVNDKQKALAPEDIGFRLGPRINAIGRLSDPQIVIDLLTADDTDTARDRAQQCEETNRHRQHLCREIEREAIALLDETEYRQRRVILLGQPHWHHGTIGIVASRLVERTGVPVFLYTAEDEGGTHLRGSARGIHEFHVFEAIDFCGDLLDKYGGHKAAGGFSLQASQLEAFGDRLSEFACAHLKPEHLLPLVNIDAAARFAQLDAEFYRHIDSLQPWGIGNEQPVFWTPDVVILDQRRVGENHLKLTVAEATNPEVALQAIAWRWGEYYPLPARVDLAYKLRENTWRGRTSLELELTGARAATTAIAQAAAVQVELPQQTEFEHEGRPYICRLWSGRDELRIRNERGKVLCVRRGRRIGLLHPTQGVPTEVDVTRSPFRPIVKAAVSALARSAIGR